MSRIEWRWMTEGVWAVVARRRVLVTNPDDTAGCPTALSGQSDKFQENVKRSKYDRLDFFVIL